MTVGPGSPQLHGGSALTPFLLPVSSSTPWSLAQAGVQTGADRAMPGEDCIMKQKSPVMGPGSRARDPWGGVEGRPTLWLQAAEFFGLCPVLILLSAPPSETRSSL